MFKYLMEVYKFLAGEDTAKNEKKEETKSKTGLENPNELATFKEKNMIARVSYQYPKGKYNFPLVIDDELKSKPERMKRTKKEGLIKSQSPKNISKKVEINKLKKSFKATEVPSPIHGFGERRSKSEIIEYELSSSSPKNSEPDTLNSIENVTFEPETALRTSNHEEVDIHIKTINEYEIFDNEINEEDIYDTVKVPFNQVEVPLMDEKIHIEGNQGEHLNKKEIELVKTNADEKKKAQTNRQVPFNVVMLKQDRERLKEINAGITEKHTDYQFPPLQYLTVPKHDVTTDNRWLAEQRELLDVTLMNFNVKASVVNVTQGPSVTRFEVHPEPGVKVNKITNLSDDIKLSLSARDIRIEAPIPGKNTIGIEVPNKISKPVLLSEIIKSKSFLENPSPLTVALGLDISGNPIVTDLKKMPHGLIAGATGSGKSVCINSMLVSLLYKASPHEVKLLLIDPKMVELAPYNDIPHLVSPVITNVKAATGALKWAVEEMERRYERFAHAGARDISRYNELVKEHNEPSGAMPFLVIIIDELADLMMVAPGEVEESICRIAQKARACGIHLLLATQRPSVDVITGLIKANVPTRIAFSVSSQIDSRTIIDSSGAEKLLGKGDMLFLENGSSKPVRLQGNFVSDSEIEAAVAYVKSQQKPEYLFEQQELISKSAIMHDEDDLFYEACEYVIDHGGASSSSLQRRFRIGYNRAARLIEMMHDQGIVSEQKGSKPRDVLITEEQLVEIHETKTNNTY